MVLHRDLLDALKSLGNQRLPIQIPLGMDHLTQRGLGFGMLGGKDCTAILIRQNGGFQRTDLVFVLMRTPFFKTDHSD